MAATSASRIVCPRLPFSEKKSVKKSESLPVFFSFRSFPLTKSLKQDVSRTEKEARGKNCSSEYCLLDVHSVCVQFTVRNRAFLMRFRDERKTRRLKHA